MAVLLKSTAAVPTASAPSWHPRQLSPPHRDADEARRSLKRRQELKRGDDPLADYLAFSDLAAFDLPVIAEAALTELQRGPIEHLPAARRLIAGFAATDTLVVVLEDGLDSKYERVRQQVILALGLGLPQSVAWQDSVQDALGDASDLVRAAAVETLGVARERKALDAILDMQDDPSVRVRQRLPEALVRLAGDRCLPMLTYLARDASWRVRSATIRALGMLRGPDAMDAILARLEDEQGRVQEDAYRELKRRTGRDFGLNTEAWRTYLRVRPVESSQTGATDSDSDSDSGDGDGDGDGEPETEPTSIGPTRPVSVATTAEYYGLSTLSRRLVVVTDLSRSMVIQETPLVERLEDEPGGTISRMDMTRRQLTTLLAELSEDVALNLVSFSNDVNFWKRELVPMGSGRRSGALREINGYAPRDQTNVYDALEACFAMAEPSLDEPDEEPACPDTVFLLTDGTPTAGRIRKTRLLLEYVTERNRDLGLRIHCIALTTDEASRSFMRELAESAEGHYACPFE